MYKPVYGDLQGRFQSTSLFPPFPNQKDHNLLLLERGIRAATVPRLLFSRIDFIFRSYPLFLLLFFSFWVTTYFLLLALYSFRHLVHIVQIL